MESTVLTSFSGDWGTENSFSVLQSLSLLTQALPTSLWHVPELSRFVQFSGTRCPQGHFLIKWEHHTLGTI